MQPLPRLDFTGGIQAAHPKPPAADHNALAAALGTYAAKVEYASNDAPFAVFDVFPRKLELTVGAADPKEASLMFVATDVLSYWRNSRAAMASSASASKPKGSMATAARSG